MQRHIAKDLEHGIPRAIPAPDLKEAAEEAQQERRHRPRPHHKLAHHLEHFPQRVFVHVARHDLLKHGTEPVRYALVCLGVGPQDEQLLQ